ncbi:MAG: sulfite exporter TauE/SafE family protein [Chloroflexi bacterium]|uniref:Sulfite exporter TauE/SafE family protein n=1 Tax=Candidatus Chlorohelix allophototropha TaxID=3003348 RepID=A0A8T7M445_9CHLR|nr:sulfite exporter TauE/SafE family protein [Chloroflexota bacterium]WJW70156.1 sulfite exporter TauE/SafE family protein [Chloroflexota bacterium L227-S17]
MSKRRKNSQKTVSALKANHVTATGVGVVKQARISTPQPVVQDQPKPIPYGLLGFLATLCVGLLLIPSALNIGNVTDFTGAGSLLIVFLTGLTTGGLSCMAVQGGLLATLIARREESRQSLATGQGNQALPIIVFLGAKLLVYTLLGLLLGWSGSLFTITTTDQGVINLFVGLFMLATALNLLQVHPIFRYFAIQPPRRALKYLRRYSKSEDYFAPAFLGFLTILIPCGTTIAMEALAIGTGNPLSGALIMGGFVLGTSPLFFTLGYFATRLGALMHARFMKIAAFSLILLSIISLNTSLNLLDFPVSLNTIANAFSDTSEGGVATAVLPATSPGTGSIDAQEVTIKVTSSAYLPGNVQVKSGQPIRLNLITQNTQGCVRSFTLNKFGIRKVLPTTGQTVVEIPAQQPGTIRYTCSMGMYSGTITVV